MMASRLIISFALHNRRKSNEEVDLKDRGALRLGCDWGVGIGGGIWTTGLLLVEHMSEHSALYDDVFRGTRVLELGSGTGLVGEPSLLTWAGL